MTGFREYRKEDFWTVINLDLREIDKLECRASVGREPKEVLRLSIAASTAGLWVIEVDGKVEGVFGLAPIADKVVAPWLLMTEKVHTVKVQFLRTARALIGIWMQKNNALMNYVAADNKQTIRWLKWIGFTIIDTQPITLHDPNVEFYPFYKVKGVHTFMTEYVDETGETHV